MAKKTIEGSVTLTVESFNAIMKQINAYENAIKVTGYTSTWRSENTETVSVSVNLNAFKDVILEKIQDLEPNYIALALDTKKDWVNQDANNQLASRDIPKVEE